jgi:endonuclease YncB( thermonuclease family)
MTKRQQKQLVRLVIMIAIGLVGFLANRQATPAEVLGTISPGYYRVTEFADGDTISVNMDGHDERIRMIGVDTPETHDPRKPVQCFGQAASNFTRNLIGSNPVRLESDDSSQNRDRYDRLLRYVYLPDGRLVQREIIRAGYGFAYTSFPFSKSSEFKQLETEAREQNRGLWANCSPTVNEHGGFTSNDD